MSPDAQRRLHVLSELRRFALDVRGAQIAREDRELVPAALTVMMDRAEPPAWMRTPGRTLHPALGGEEAAKVALHPDAGLLLGHALRSCSSLDPERARIEVWLDTSDAQVRVHIGCARVGDLDEAVSARLRPLIEAADHGRVRSVADLHSPVRPGAPHVLTVKVPAA